MGVNLWAEGALAIVDKAGANMAIFSRLMPLKPPRSKFMKKFRALWLSR